MRDRGSYDEWEKTWKDEDGSRLRVTFEPGDPSIAVLRVWSHNDRYWKYFELSDQDRQELIKVLRGEKFD